MDIENSPFQWKREAWKPNEIRKFALKNYYFYIGYSITYDVMWPIRFNENKEWKLNTREKNKTLYITKQLRKNWSFSWISIQEYFNVHILNTCIRL